MERQKYLADLLYLLERTGAVGLREVLMSDISFAVGKVGGEVNRLRNVSLIYVSNKLMHGYGSTSVPRHTSPGLALI